MASVGIVGILGMSSQPDSSAGPRGVLLQLVRGGRGYSEIPLRAFQNPGHQELRKLDAQFRSIHVIPLGSTIVRDLELPQEIKTYISLRAWPGDLGSWHV